MSTPKILIRLSGDDSVTNWTEETSWTLNGKMEKDYSINSADGAQTIDLSGIADINYISFNSTGEFTITITDAGGDVDITVRDFFLFRPTAAFVTGLTSITITSLSSSAQTISVRVYGE